jgi:hypothetical protein
MKNKKIERKKRKKKKKTTTTHAPDGFSDNR